MRFDLRATIVAAAMTIGASGASAAVVFTDSFNSYTGSSAAAQAATGLTVEAFGALSNWNASGQNAIHAVDRGAGDWAVMFYGGDSAAQTNAITLKNAISANAASTVYQISFAGAAASYNNASQGNVANDYVKFDVLRANGSLLTSYLYDPADWSNNPNNPFTAGAFSYTGDGSGDVTLRISAQATPGHFGGAIDNLSVSSVPEPASWAMMIGGFGMIGATMRRRKTSVRFA